MRARIAVKKMAVYSIVINALQIVAMVMVMILVLMDTQPWMSPLLVDTVMFVCAGLVCWGAATDIRDARSAMKVTQQADALEQAYAQLEALNRTMRTQRHDFMNHLQVVFSLIELGDGKEACDYIERVHGDIQRVNIALKTASPAVNALLQAKAGDCEMRGIHMEVTIHSQWKNLPLPGWEMCRVLGNLIDNAMDALKEVPDPRLTVELAEDIKGYRFRVGNNGPAIPKDIVERLFVPGFTTKLTGQGMGLHIVSTLLAGYGGQIQVYNAPQAVAFEGFVPLLSQPVPGR